MPETQTTSPTGQEHAVFTIPWSEKRKEFQGALANEAMIAQAWDINEDLIFFFLMWLGTY